MPVSRNDHHAQLFATPRSRTRFVTRLGVSVLNVVATIETPISHHGAERPEVKNSAVLDPARFASTTAGMNETTIETTTMIQSSVTSGIASPGGGRGTIPSAGRVRQERTAARGTPVWSLGRDDLQESTTEAQRAQRRCTRERCPSAGTIREALGGVAAEGCSQVLQHRVPAGGQPPVCPSSVPSVPLWSIPANRPGRGIRLVCPPPAAPSPECWPSDAPAPPAP